MGGYGTANNFYPRSPCGERPVPQQENGQAATISIHALLAESDPRLKPSRRFLTPFLSTLSLRRATVTGDTVCHAYQGFLSTLSLRRATTSRLHKILADWDFYPRSPCGERRKLLPAGILKEIFLSTLSLRRATILHTVHLMELLFLSTLSLRRATQHENAGDMYQCKFLSTLSLRRATARRESRQQPAGISIHAAGRFLLS